MYGTSGGLAIRPAGSRLYTHPTIDVGALFAGIQASTVSWSVHHAMNPCRSDGKRTCQAAPNRAPADRRHKSDRLVEGARFAFASGKTDQEEGRATMEDWKGGRWCSGAVGERPDVGLSTSRGISSPLLT